MSEVQPLTVVLTLRDRHEYTEFFMRNSVFPKYHYLVLDGSTSGANEAVISTLKLPNVEYVRYEPDRDFAQYITKVSAGLELVQTPFLVMIDNDDLLLPNGVDLAVRALLQDENLSLAGGDLAGFCHPGPGSTRSSWPMRLTESKDLSGLSGVEAVTRNRRSYRPIWNLISRARDFREAWEIAASSSIVEPHLIEFLVADLMVAKGRFRWQPTPHYLRLENQQNRAIHDLEQGEDMTIGSDSWWQQARELSGLVDAALAPSAESVPDLRTRWKLLTDGIIPNGHAGTGLFRVRAFAARASALLPLSVTTRLAERGVLIPIPLYRS